MADSIFSRMNRKQKREFDKLPPEEKIQIFTAELQNKVNESMRVEIPNAFYRGYLQAHQLLYEKYCEPIMKSENEDEVKQIVGEMLKCISKNNELSVAEFAKLSDKDKSKGEE